MAEEQRNGQTTKKRRCFVVSPIGSPGSPDRRHADQVLEHIIHPAFEELPELKFDKPERADKMADPGLITRQVISRLLNDDLVIADLTGSNPNVFYELAIRHATGRPFVQMTSAGSALPFDVAPQKTIFFDRLDWDSIKATKAALKAQVTAAMAPDFRVETPIGHALDFERLRSGGPMEQMMAQMMDRIETMSAEARQADAFSDAYTLGIGLGPQDPQYDPRFRASKQRGPTTWSSVREAAKSHAVRFAKETFNRDLTPEQLEGVLLQVRSRVRGLQISDMDLAAAITQELMNVFGSPPPPT